MRSLLPADGHVRSRTSAHRILLLAAKASGALHSGQSFAASSASARHAGSGEAVAAAAPGFHTHASPVCSQGIMSRRPLLEPRRSQVCLCLFHLSHILPVSVTDNRPSDHPTSLLVSSERNSSRSSLKSPPSRVLPAVSCAGSHSPFSTPCDRTAGLLNTA